MPLRFNYYIETKQDNILEMMAQFISFFMLSACYLKLGYCFSTRDPQWQTSNYFRAANQKVISTLTGNDQTPTYTFTFSSELPGVPSLAYGIKNYVGDDYLGIQSFEIRRIDLTKSTFKVSVQIIGTTNVYVLNVPYIAVSPQFQHHLNSFDNVPVNYNSGDLVNITDKSTDQIQTYTNTINYTQQAASMKTKTFSTPLSNNKILLYLTAIEIRSTFNDEGPYYPIDFDVQTQIISTQTYQIRVSLKNNTQITILRFSQIIFDSADVQSKNKYSLYSQKIDIPNEGQFIPLPQEFIDNFIMGLLDFSTLRGRSVLHYNWEFQTLNGVFGAQVYQSTPKSHLVQSGLSRMGTMIFYIKTWKCPSGFPYFNLTSNKCQDECGDYHYEDTAQDTCLPCSNKCKDCTSPNDCLNCDQTRMLNNDRCDCIAGYYEVVDQYLCNHCSVEISNCIACNKIDQQIKCTNCAYDYFLTQNNTCVIVPTCTNNSFLNKQQNICQACKIKDCSNCESHEICIDCSVGYWKNTSNQCVKCQIFGCQDCVSTTQCKKCKETFIFSGVSCKCDHGRYTDSQNQVCVQCHQSCKTCTGPSSSDCSSCDFFQNRKLNSSTCECTQNYREPNIGSVCEKIDEKLCNYGYTLASGKCTDICGDGILIDLQCDDGNIVNGDGCSDSCTVEDSSACSFKKYLRSLCLDWIDVPVKEVIIIKKSDSNGVQMVVSVEPDAEENTEYNIGKALVFAQENMKIDQSTISDGNLHIDAVYDDDLEGKKTSLSVKNKQNTNNPSKAPYEVNKTTIHLQAHNNLDLFHYPEEDYSYKNISQALSLIITFISLLALVLSSMLKNPFPAFLIFSNMQIVFLSLSTINGLHPIVHALVNMKPVMGLNFQGVFPQNQLQNRRVRELGYDGSFANNFNLSLFIQVGLCIIIGFFSCMKEQKLKRIFQKLIFLTIIFSSSQLFFSLAVTKSFSRIDLLFGVLSIGLFLGQVIFNYKTAQLGQFKKALVGYFLCRFVLCFQLGLGGSDSTINCLFAVIIQLLFISYLCYNRLIARVKIESCFILAQAVSMLAFAVIFLYEKWSLDERSQGWILLTILSILCLLTMLTVLQSILKSEEKVEKVISMEFRALEREGLQQN